MALQADGKIVVAGVAAPAARDFALARYNADGTLDTTFDGDGKQTTDFGGVDDGRRGGVQADGKIVVAGQRPALALARYNADGTLDTSFSATAS